MKHRKRSVLFALVAAGAALPLGAPAALAQHSHDEKQPEHGHGAGEKHEAPKTYAEGVAEIDERLENIGGLIKSKKLDDVHKEAEVVATVANTLASLALKPGSGVARENVKEINLTAKELAGKFDAIDKAGDSGDEAGVKKVLAEMTALQEKLKKYVPAGAGEHAHDTYYCVMHCEGGKTYDKPGKCPKCGMNLKKLTTDQYSCEVKPMGGGPITPGKPTTLTFAFKDPTGAACKDFNIVHEKPLHLLMVSKDMSWYAHEHPEVQSDGTFKLTFTFPAGGEYRLFNDFTPKDVGMQVVPVTLKVEGAAPAAKALTPDAETPKTVEGYTVTLDTGGPVKTGDETHLVYTISKDGKPVTDLRPYLGAMGHLVIISQDQKQFVHSHPHEDGDEHAGSKTGPKVDFEAVFAEPGLYKGWAQFQVSTGAGGKVITVPFTFNVAKGEGTAKPHRHDGKGDHDDDHGKKPGHDHGK